MKKNKRPIKYKKERVVLSDVLPFEIPITFSNRHFYDFLIKNKIELSGNKIKWDKNENTLNTIIKLLFDFRDKAVITNEIGINRKWELKTIPFNYKISHKENDFRELTIVHPKNQLALIEFYEANKQLILHYCSLSPFSIRRADKVAKFIFHKDKTHKDKLSNNQDYETVEEYDKEYESLKTFFLFTRITATFTSFMNPTSIIVVKKNITNFSSLTYQNALTAFTLILFRGLCSTKKWLKTL